MGKEVVLISGATGHIGFRTLVVALQSNYSVRAQVRNDSGRQKILAAPSVQPHISSLSFVNVPDIEAAGAWDAAVEGVSYVIHIASPIGSPKSGVTPPEPHEYEERYVNPAVRGTTSLLTSALRGQASGLKRIVITASIVSIIPMTDLVAESGTVYTERSRIPLPSTPYGGVFEAYSASKVKAFLEAEDFVTRERPAWDLNFVAPSFTIGKHELIKETGEILDGTNGSALGRVLGQKADSPLPSASVHVDDIALMHVRALAPEVPGGQFFIGVSEGSRTHWEDVENILRKRFPRAVKAGIFQLGDASRQKVTKELKLDNAWTAKTLGIEFKGFEEQVVSVTGHYLELVGFDEKEG